MEDLELLEEELRLLEGDDSSSLGDTSDKTKIKRNYIMEILIGIMLFTMIFLYFAERFYVVIPAGYKAALFRTFGGGTQLEGVYLDEGFHVKFPWDEVYQYNTRIREHQDVIDALTEDGLAVTAEISYRYFPDYHRIGRLHREIGPEYLYTILVPHITAITRDVISHYRVDRLYSTARDSIQIDMTQRTQSQITDNYPITIIDVVVRNIILHESVQNAIAKKLVREQEVLEYDFRLALEGKEADRKAIEARGIKAFQDTSQIDILQWEGINATKELAKSQNAKIIVIGTDSGDLPVILGGSN